MKLTAKSQYFKPSQNMGFFENAFLKTGRTIIENDFIRIVWFFGYTENDQDIIVSELPPISFSEKQITYILDGNDEPIDIVEFLSGGGIYEKSRISHWGRPSKDDMLNLYLKTESLRGDLELTDIEPQRSIAKDWIAENVIAFGAKAGQNFEF